jgi:hypothetical protein
LYGSAKGSESLLFRAINPDDKRPIQALRGMLWLRKIELGAGQNEGYKLTINSPVASQ